MLVMEEIRATPETIPLDPPHAAIEAPTASTAASANGWDLVDEWGAQSFPASDPPANW